MTDALARLSEVDDCWNRIGIRGDKSCERLPEHVHCRNCPVYAAAAKRILDRLPPQAAVLAARLQAEVEQAMRLALADAIEQIQARMDEELPRIVARVLQDVRPG